MIRFEIIKNIQRVLFDKNEKLYEHGIRVFIISRSLGKKLKLSEEELRKLDLLSIFHDIGKISINNDIIEKSLPLIYEENEILRKHYEAGYWILKCIPELSDIAELVLYQNERWDGKGAPKNLSKEEIPLLSRVISVVNAYDEMVNSSLYNKNCFGKDIVFELIKNSGKKFDPKIIKAFLDILNEVETLKNTYR